jgi:hypothetical protein
MREMSFPTVAPPQDAAARVKVMRCPAKLWIDGNTVIDAKAVQISQGGVGLITSRSVRDGQQCTVQVNPLINGNPVRLKATGTVTCCTCIGMEGFRISLRFSYLDDETTMALEMLLQTR